MRSDPGVAAVLPTLYAQNYVLTRRQALDLGITAGWWRGGLGGALVPIFRGVGMVRVPGAPLEPGCRQRARAALLCVGLPTGAGRAVLGLGSVLRLHRIEGTPFNDPEHLIIEGVGWRSRAGIARHCYALSSGDVETRFGLPVTTLERALRDCVAGYDREHAVSVMDSALYQRLITKPELVQLVAGLSRERRGWVLLTDPKCESPLETRTRLLCQDAGLPWTSQLPLMLPGFGEVRLDLQIGEWTVVESDGRKEHDKLAARYRDRQREDAIRDTGREVTRVIWRDVSVEKVATLRRILAAVERAESRHRRAS